MEQIQLIISTKVAAESVLVDLLNKIKPDLDSLNKWGEATLRYDFNVLNGIKRTEGQELQNLLRQLTREILNGVGTPIVTVQTFLSELQRFASQIRGHHQIEWKPQFENTQSINYIN